MEIAKFFLRFCFVSLILHASVAFAQNSARAFVDAHNAVRAEVGVPAVSWNRTVARYARRYAFQNVAKCQLEHSGGSYGENIAMGFMDFSGNEAVHMWASEKPHYDNISNSCKGGECLHYTQIVWRNTKSIGCARVKCTNGWVFVTCNYSPPGNYMGERPY